MLMHANNDAQSPSLMNHDNDFAIFSEKKIGLSPEGLLIAVYLALVCSILACLT